LAAVRKAVRRGRPYGSSAEVEAMARRLPINWVL
jgi:hypothetical protein